VAILDTRGHPSTTLGASLFISYYFIRPSLQIVHSLWYTCCGVLSILRVPERQRLSAAHRIINLGASDRPGPISTWRSAPIFMPGVMCFTPSIRSDLVSVTPCLSRCCMKRITGPEPRESRASDVHGCVLCLRRVG
jgi:hypothetical protein